MNCEHQFIEMEKVNRPTDVSFRTDFGIKVQCSLCGQVRHMWTDGTVEVVIEQGTVTRKDDKANQKRD